MQKERWTRNIEDLRFNNNAMHKKIGIRKFLMLSKLSTQLLHSFSFSFIMLKYNNHVYKSFGIDQTETVTNSTNPQPKNPKATMIADRIPVGHEDSGLAKRAAQSVLLNRPQEMALQTGSPKCTRAHTTPSSEPRPVSTESRHIRRFKILRVFE